MPTWLKWGIALIVVMFVVVAIPSRDDSPPLARAVATPPTPPRAPACEDVSRAKLDHIQMGLHRGLTLRSGKAHRSGSHRNAWFVSAELDGPGLERTGDLATWFVTSLNPMEGLVYAVPRIATEFSQWGDASKTDAEASMGDPGAMESRECMSE